MTNKHILPVILCGGIGSRLWPLSRTSYPKQFLSLNQNSNNTFLQETYKRLEGIENLLEPIIVCNEMHRFIVAEQLREKNINPSTIFLEPFGKNTAPAVLIAALQAIDRGDDPSLLILSADHFIKDNEKFRNTIKYGLEYSKNGNLVTFGVLPNKPETGYGYIEVSRKIIEEEIIGFCINSFVEKPDLETAEKFLFSKKYFWNSGIFLFKASVIINQIKILCLLIFTSVVDNLEVRFINFTLIKRVLKKLKILLLTQMKLIFLKE